MNGNTWQPLDLGIRDYVVRILFYNNSKPVLGLDDMTYLCLYMHPGIGILGHRHNKINLKNDFIMTKYGACSKQLFEAINYLVAFGMIKTTRINAGRHAYLLDPYRAYIESHYVAEFPFQMLEWNEKFTYRLDLTSAGKRYAHKLDNLCKGGYYGYCNDYAFTATKRMLLAKPSLCLYVIKREAERLEKVGLRHSDDIQLLAHNYQRK